jgi:hypothetical protein
MENYKVLIESVMASDAAGLTKVQTKINQWITTGILRKYEIHTAGEYVVFNICKKKEA